MIIINACTNIIPISKIEGQYSLEDDILLRVLELEKKGKFSYTSYKNGKLIQNCSGKWWKLNNHLMFDAENPVKGECYFLFGFIPDQNVSAKMLTSRIIKVGNRKFKKINSKL